MLVQIRRETHGPAAINLSATLANCTEIPTKSMVMGTIHITDAVQPASSVAMAVYVASEASGRGGVYRQLFDEFGAAVSIPGVITGQAYAIPGPAFGSPFIKLVLASGSDAAAQVTLGS